MATKEDFTRLSPSDFRQKCRRGEYTQQTSGVCNGWAQANLCILPKEYAFDFLLFCHRNPKPCPLLECLDGIATFGNDIDIRTDLPRYRIYENGVFTREVDDLNSVWRTDFVTFVIGCSFSFEEALLRAGICVRHLELAGNKTVPMFSLYFHLQGYPSF